ncbi:MAG: hypothetical protein M0R51_11690 [Clostridia bacterium]|jgi:hypothetical protein|nr:hypothetical protein [Clostridia bacterium]
MRFDGDIVITDPLYVVNIEDWDKCKDGKDLSYIGLENFMVTNTLCGDWECIIINDSNKQIGHILADTGLVGVFSLSEIRKYSKTREASIKIAKPIVTIIYDFHGDVQFYKSIQDDIEYTKIKGVGNINFQNILDI